MRAVSKEADAQCPSRLWSTEHPEGVVHKRAVHIHLGVRGAVCGAERGVLGGIRHRRAGMSALGFHVVEAPHNPYISETQIERPGLHLAPTAGSRFCDYLLAERICPVRPGAVWVSLDL